MFMRPTVVLRTAMCNPPNALGKSGVSGGGARGDRLSLAFLTERLAHEPAKLIARVLALLEHGRLALAQHAALAAGQLSAREHDDGQLARLGALQQPLEHAETV